MDDYWPTNNFTAVFNKKYTSKLNSFKPNNCGQRNDFDYQFGKQKTNLKISS